MIWPILVFRRLRERGTNLSLWLKVSEHPEFVGEVLSCFQPSMRIYVSIPFYPSDFGSSTEGLEGLRGFNPDPGIESRLFPSVLGVPPPFPPFTVEGTWRGRVWFDPVEPKVAIYAFHPYREERTSQERSNHIRLSFSSQVDIESFSLSKESR